MWLWVLATIAGARRGYGHGVLGRRGVLAGAVGLAALTACDVDDLRPPEDEAEPTPSASPSPTTEPDQDVQLAAWAGFQIGATLAIVDEVRRTWPRLRGRLQPLAQMHRTHGEVLPAEDDAVFPPALLIGTPGEALASVREAERALQGRLVAAAKSAQSGALARLLASVSASVSQHMAALG